MFLDNLLRQGQSQPDPDLLCRKVRLEHLRQVFCCNSIPGILEADLNPPPAACLPHEPGGNRQFPSLRHGLEGIDENIDEAGPDLLPSTNAIGSASRALQSIST